MKEKIMKAKVRMTVDNPYNAAIILSLNFVADYRIEGMYSTDKDVIYNPKCSYSLEEIENFLYNVVDDLIPKGVGREFLIH